MGVLTHDEYEDIQEEKNITAKPESEHKPLSGFTFSKNKIEYHLFHPDNTSFERINKKYNVQIEGKKFELDIIDGVIVTDDINIKSHLMEEGFIYLYEKETEMSGSKNNRAKQEEAKITEKTEDKEVEIKEKIKDEKKSADEPASIEPKEEKKSDGKDYFLLSSFSKNPKELKVACTQKMFVPHAPKGECNTAFWCQNKEVKVKLIDGIVFVDNRDHIMIEEMVKQDFVKI